jgi:hypothetical protein
MDLSLDLSPFTSRFKLNRGTNAQHGHVPGGPLSGNSHPSAYFPYTLEFAVLRVEASVQNCRHPMLASNLILQSAVRAKCDFFVEAQLWPLEKDFNPEGWLRNFRSDEMEHAAALLNCFMFFSTDLTSQLFRTGFRRLGSRVCSDRSLAAR